VSDVQQLISRLEQAGGTLALKGDRIRYAVPKGNPEVLGLLAELRAHREAVMVLLLNRAAVESERRFAQPHARLFPFIGRRVWTPSGAGLLLAVHADQCEVLPDGSDKTVRVATSSVRPIQ